eukprot:CAMPEP_0173098112 /NCGR_PEP_ID=MMETSP1102-20130122/34476_1 /TAXON_ID=49646 /ORGANISM="Geminigera sp., Strain Caron Lab Isolate" /LENGTH=196 /DNA_ID=CAMNT_0013990425 /DNA_START=207 /DNA_END=797 /DNA_ORIENTATION=+
MPSLTATGRAKSFRGRLNKPQQWSLEHLQTLAAEAKRNLNPNLRKTGLVLHCPSSDGESDGESAEANYVDPENELIYGRDEKGEASYGRTHDSRRSDLDDDYSALSASAGGQSKGAGPKRRRMSAEGITHLEQLQTIDEEIRDLNARLREVRDLRSGILNFRELLLEATHPPMTGAREIRSRRKRARTRVREMSRK